MSTMRNKVLNLAARQVGYKESGDNITKYAKYFDDPKGAWQWFNTKKNGVPGAAGGWCSIFICWLFCQNEILGPKKALKFLGCPAPQNNCAAGVPYLWEYLTARGWKVDKKKGAPGDIIFFNSKKHVGIIEKVEGSKYYTIEGNKNNMVKRCSYAITSSSVYGICRPAWAEIEPKTEPTPEPITTPEPLKDPKPATAPTATKPQTATKYIIKTNTGAPLALRTAPKRGAVCLEWMKNGASLKVNSFVKGEKVGSSDKWAHCVYNGRTGYTFAAYLKKA